MTAAYKPTPVRGAWAACGAALGVACAAIVGPFVDKWENGGSLHTVAYHGAADRPGIWTICSGETLGVHPGMTATPAQCQIMADSRAAQFGQAVLDATPRLKGHPYQLAAATSLAYNIGVPAYSRSMIDHLFDAGRWRAACDGFTAWNKVAGKVVQGLVNRRAAERSLCLTELPK